MPTRPPANHRLLAPRLAHDRGVWWRRLPTADRCVLCHNLPLTCATGTLAHVAQWVVKRDDMYLGAYIWRVDHLDAQTWAPLQPYAARMGERDAKRAAGLLSGRAVRLVPRGKR